MIRLMKEILVKTKKLCYLLEIRRLIALFSCLLTSVMVNCIKKLFME